MRIRAEDYSQEKQQLGELRDQWRELERRREDLERELGRVDKQASKVTDAAWAIIEEIPLEIDVFDLFGDVHPDEW